MTINAVKLVILSHEEAIIFHHPESGEMWAHCFQHGKAVENSEMSAEFMAKLGTELEIQKAKYGATLV